MRYLQKSIIFDQQLLCPAHQISFDHIIDQEVLLTYIHTPSFGAWYFLHAHDSDRDYGEHDINVKILMTV